MKMLVDYAKCCGTCCWMYRDGPDMRLRFCRLNPQPVEVEITYACSHWELDPEWKRIEDAVARELGGFYPSSQKMPSVGLPGEAL